MSDGGSNAVELIGSYDYLLKFIVIGESSTGKTSLLYHFLHDEYKEQAHTIGVAFSSTLLRLPSTVTPPSGAIRSMKEREKRIKIQLWDTAGQERFRSVARSYYRSASGVLLCYDVTRRATFDNLMTWLQDARALASDKCAIALVGCKVDREDLREVSQGEGSAFAREHGLLFVEVSALSGENVQQPFLLLAKAILLSVESGRLDPDAPGSGVSYGERALKRVSSWGDSLKLSSSGFAMPFSPARSGKCC